VSSANTTTQPRAIKFDPPDLYESIARHAELYHTGNFSSAVRELCKMGLEQQRDRGFERVDEPLYRRTVEDG